MMTSICSPSVVPGSPQPRSCVALQAEATSAGAQRTDSVELSLAAPTVDAPVCAARVAALAADPVATAASAVPGPTSTCLRLIIAGPPGAGKTTHGNAIARTFGVPEISIGNLLRDEIKQGSEIGRQIEPILERGDLAPIEIVASLLESRLRQPDTAHGFVLDGIPRRMEDADLLEHLSERLGLGPIPMLLLDVPDAEIVGRVENRRICDNQHTWDIRSNPPKVDGVCDQDGLALHRRPDDEPEVVRHRLALYHQETEPVIAHYETRGWLHRIDGVGDIEGVSARALEAARSLATPS